MEEGICYLNGSFVAARDAKVSIFDRGFTSGEGVYDVTRSFGHKLFKLDAHVARLYRSLKYTRIDCGLSAADMTKLSIEVFERIDDGRRPGYAEVKLTSVTTGSQGKVDLVPPRAIHAEQGGSTRSVAVIVRSQKLGEGTVLQHRYDRDTNTVVEQYGPTQIPYELTE